MKYLFILLLILLIPNLLICQTKELEIDNLNLLVESGDKSQKELKEISVAFQKLLEDFGGYPILPYNPENKNIEFVFTNNIPDVSKKDIYNRVKEWVSIHYGSINSVLHYEDYDSGKIIVKGSFNIVVQDVLSNFWGNPKDAITAMTCFQTVVFTVKEEKIKVEYIDIKFETTGSSLISGGMYYTPQISKYNLHELYPVTKSDPITWKSRLSTLNTLTFNIALSQSSKIKYIELIKEDYEF